ncbi:MAG: DNA-3-methyladenine glycosylase I [Candidatus Meridianibacter frigidus]|nr:MAG: DNA-3-methyladenine glycosylase I [Candidatus Eremiobacteraeota bacterium]
MKRKRCAWAKGELATLYHDREWGVPVHDDRTLFEFLILEGAQAGLSWDTILRKRAAYRAAFASFEPQRVARFTQRDITRLMNDSGIVRNRLKIESAIGNARAFLAMQEAHDSFDAYLQLFTDASELSKDLRKRGFRFVGPTICYAFMQAVGMVNGHDPSCFRHAR